MSLKIQLLGRPQVLRGGSPAVRPRGHKTWALLAYLVRCDARPTRDALAGMLFAEADDPLGALTWTLSEIRRALGSPDSARGDPVDLAVPAGTAVDVDVLIHGSWQDALHLPGLGHRLLEGVNLTAAPGFELWLENQQRRVAEAAQGILHEAALATLAQGDAVAALDLASRLVELDPLDENSQVAYVRCLSRAGDVEGARRQVEACTTLFRRELGVEPTAALREAVEVRSRAARASGHAEVLAQLEAGEAAVAAGAVNPGLDILHQAVVDAETGRTPDGYVEFLRGGYARAESWLSRAASLAGPRSEELACARRSGRGPNRHRELSGGMGAIERGVGASPSRRCLTRRGLGAVVSRTLASPSPRGAGGSDRAWPSDRPGTARRLELVPALAGGIAGGGRPERRRCRCCHPRVRSCLCHGLPAR